jgi:hypothetical protein
MTSRVLFIFLLFSFNTYSNSKNSNQENLIHKKIIESEKSRVIPLAESFLNEKPITVTSHTSIRSAGDIHDYYSEGTYWWPNPDDIDGPYIRKDGVNNPDNFDHHRQAISRLSLIVSSLSSAYLLTGDEKYAKSATKHLKAWFVDSETLMNPNMLYAQAIKGVNTGRGIGIIDAIPFIEVTKSVEVLAKTSFLSKSDNTKIHAWFRNFMLWLNSHQYGIDEMNAKNNHGTWWHAQVAAYACFVGDKSMLEKCKNHYINNLLPTQMANNGSLPLELERTKPYSYSLFCLDGFATLTYLLTDKNFDAWNYKLLDGRGMRLAVNFMKPFVVDKNKWTFPPDILFWDEQPGRRPFMIFAALIQNEIDWITIWQKSNPSFPSDESLRNMPVKNPVLWIHNFKL